MGTPRHQITPTPHDIWTRDRVTDLKQLWADGLSARVIADRMACFGHCMDGGRSAVIGKVQRLGLPGRLARSQPAASRPPVQRADAGVLRRITAKPRAENDPHKFEAEVAVDLPPDQSPDAVAFLARRKAQCAWPLNSVTPINLHVACGSKCDGDHSYCPRHHRLSVQASRPRAPELSDAVRAQRAVQARKNLAAHKERLLQV